MGAAELARTMCHNGIFALLAKNLLLGLLVKNQSLPSVGVLRNQQNHGPQASIAQSGRFAELVFQVLLDWAARILVPELLG